MRVWWVAAVTLVLLVSACGGGGGGTSAASSSHLSATAYRAQLRKIAKEYLTAQYAALQASSQAKSVRQLVTVETAYASSIKRIGAEVAALNPPTNAEAANTEFAKGFQDAAAETDAQLPKIEKMPSVHAAIAYLSNQRSPTKGDHEISHAHTTLLRLGYMNKGE